MTKSILRSKDMLMLAGLVILCVITFARMFENQFVWDDKEFIVQNPSIRGFLPLSRFFSPQSISSGGNPILTLTGHRSILTFSLALDYFFWKLNPFGYHLTNLILHILCVFGVAVLGNFIFNNKNIGFLGGALFAIHPGHAEAVISFLGRSDLLATFFSLFAFILYLRMEDKKGSYKLLLYAGSLLCFLLACFSKETGLVLLGILMFYIIIHNSQFRIQNYTYILPYIAIAIFYWFYRSSVILKAGEERIWWGGNHINNSMMMMEVYLEYLRLLFFPYALAPLNSVPVPKSFFELRVILGMVLLLGTISAIVFIFKHSPKTSFLFAWFLFGLIPVSNIIPIAGMIMAERWLYFPSVGFCLLLSYGLIRFFEKRKIIGEVLILLSVIRIITYIPTWKTEESVALAAVEKSPGIAIGHNNMGKVLIDKGDYVLAEKYLREAVKLSPGSHISHNNLGDALWRQGKQEEAEIEFREAIRLCPTYAQAHSNLGAIFGNAGKISEAEKEFIEAIRLDINLAEAHNNLGLLLERTGRLREAKNSYRDAIIYGEKKGIPLPPAYLNLGIVSEILGEKEEAKKAYKEYLRLSPETRDREEVEFRLKNLE